MFGASHGLHDRFEPTSRGRPAAARHRRPSSPGSAIRHGIPRYAARMTPQGWSARLDSNQQTRSLEGRCSFRAELRAAIADKPRGQPSSLDPRSTPAYKKKASRSDPALLTKEVSHEDLPAAYPVAGPRCARRLGPPPPRQASNTADDKDIRSIGAQIQDAWNKADAQDAGRPLADRRRLRQLDRPLRARPDGGQKAFAEQWATIYKGTKIAHTFTNVASCAGTWRSPTALSRSGACGTPRARSCRRAAASRPSSP